MTRIKCCGMFREQDIDVVNAARPDYCGFIVDFPKSHRSITPERLRELRSSLAAGIQAVGVFVDQPAERVARIARDCELDLVQLHGSEDEATVGETRRLAGVPVMRAYAVRSPRDLERARASSADYVLLDSGQGSGAAFDWSLLEGFDRPYFLAGGLAPDNIAEAIERLHPYAIDLSSGLETNRLKDPVKIARAIAAARGECVGARGQGGP